MWFTHADWIIDAEFVRSNPTCQSFVVMHGDDVAVKEPSYKPKSKNDNRVVLVAVAVGSGTQKWIGDQVIALSLAHVRSAGQTARGS